MLRKCERQVPLRSNPFQLVPSVTMSAGQILGGFPNITIRSM